MDGWVNGWAHVKSLNQMNLDIINYGHFGHFIGHFYLKPPQPLMGLFFSWLTSFQLMADRVIFDIGWVVDKVCIYTMKG